MNYFKNVTDLDNLKKQFRDLCKKHHPDLGGDIETMKAINNEYTELLNNPGAFNDFDFENSSVEIEEQHRNIIEQTIIYEGLIVEICGRWIWFTGETRKYKEQLKALGCFFASKKVAWYWRPEDEKRKGGKPVPLDQIRSKYGRTVFEHKEREKVTDRKSVV